MIDTLKNILYISISNKINFLIYYFKRLPLVGKLLKDSAYKELKLKKLIEEKFKNLTEEELKEYDSKFKALPSPVKKTATKEDFIKEWIREEIGKATA